MAVEGRVGEDLRRPRVTDDVDALDLVRRPLVLTRLELAEQAVVRAAPGDQNQSVVLVPLVGPVLLAREHAGAAILAPRALAPDVVDLDPAVFDPAHPGVADHVDMQFVQAAVHVRRLEREVHVVAEADAVDHGHVVALAPQQFGQRRPHEVWLGVQDRDPLADRFRPVEDLLGRHMVRLAGIDPRNRVVAEGVGAVAVPERAGRDDHLVGAVAQHVPGGQRFAPERQLAVAVLLDQLVELDLAIVAVIAPLAEAGQFDEGVHMAADFLGTVGEMDHIAALHQHARGLASRRPGADHKNGFVGLRRRELLGVPAAAVFLARGCVLGADHRRAADLPARDADVAADAGPHVVEAAFLDLLRQERVRDRRAGAADYVQFAVADDLGHLLGIGEAADAQHRFFRVLLDDFLPRNLVTLAVETRRTGILAPFRDVADLDVPDVDQIVGQLDELDPVDLDLDTGGAIERVDGEARGDGAVVPDGVLHLLQGLDPEPGAVLERAAILVGPLVVVGRQELHRQIGMAAVDVDDIETGIARAQGGIDIILLDLTDVVVVHLVTIGQGLEFRGVLADAARGAARLHAGRVGRAVPQLDAGQRAVLVDFVAHGTQVAHIAFIPDPGRNPHRVVGFGMDRAVFGVDRAPSALGLDAAMGGLEAGLFRTRADAVRALVEPVFHHLRTNLDRFEKDVVFGRSGVCHRSSPYDLAAQGDSLR